MAALTNGSSVSFIGIAIPGRGTIPVGSIASDRFDKCTWDCTGAGWSGAEGVRVERRQNDLERLILTDSAFARPAV